MRVLIADKFEKSGVEALTKGGCQVIDKAGVGADALADAVRESDAHVLVVRSTKVNAKVFEEGKRLSLVVRAGAGYDTIDVAAASTRGVYIANCPGKNSIAVAELAWGLILACDRRIALQACDLKHGKWNKKEYSKAHGLYGRTLGVIGLGQIGLAVVERARGFGMPVLAWSRSLTEAAAEELGIDRAESPLEVAKKADVITLHVAANPDTKNLVNAEFCAALRPNSILVNTTRGSIVDEAALVKAMREKNIRVGLDVFAAEPATGEAETSIEIAREPNCIGTHHVGASTDQAQDAIAAEAARIILEFKRTGAVPNVVNRQRTSRATRLLSVRHLNRPGVLAHVVGEIGKAGINIEEMENVIYDGADAACARIQLDAEPTTDTMLAIQSGSRHVLSVDLAIIQ